MPGQDPFAHTTSIEAVSVIGAAVLVWLSALVQHLSNISERGTQYVVSDRSVSPPLQGFFGRATPGGAAVTNPGRRRSSGSKRFAGWP